MSARHRAQSIIIPILLLAVLAGCSSTETAPANVEATAGAEISGLTPGLHTVLGL